MSPFRVASLRAGGCALACLLAWGPRSVPGQDAPAAGSRLEEMQRLAGRPVRVRVLRMVAAGTIPSLTGYVWDDESPVAIIQAGSVRAILLPGHTPLTAGRTYRIRLHHTGQVAAPPRSNLPDPVSVYQEARYRDTMLFIMALQEELERILLEYLAPGYLARFVLPAERAAEITPAMFAQGLKNPLEDNLSHVFLRVESERFQVLGVETNEGNYEIRLRHAVTGEPALLYLPWNSRHPLRRAEPGAWVDTGGFVRAVNLTPGSAAVGAFYRNEEDFVECLRGRVRVMD